MQSKVEIWLKAKEKRKDLRARAIAEFGGKCKICGYNVCQAAFDFHHLDPMAKDFNISKLKSWKKIRKELEKCILLCARCHREVHDGLWPQFLMDEETYRML